MRTFLSSTLLSAGAKKHAFKSSMRTLPGVAAALFIGLAAPVQAAPPHSPPVIRDGNNNIVTSAAFVLYAGFHTAGGECSVGRRSAQCVTGQFAGTKVIFVSGGQPIVVSTGPVAEGYGKCGPGYWNQAQEAAYGICNIGISDDMNRSSQSGFTPVITGTAPTCTTTSAQLTYGFPNSQGSHSSSTADGAC